jgi:type I restriction enzyme M protein
MTLILLRYEADADRAKEGDHGTPARRAWQVLTDKPWQCDGPELAEGLRFGLQRWESAHFSLRDLPDLTDVHGRQVASLIDQVAETENPAALFEDCLQQAQASGRGGSYYTPPGMVRLLVGLMEPSAGETVYDPVCGSGGFLLGAHDYVEVAGGRAEHVKLFGQDVSRTALQTAALNLTVHGATAGLMGPASTLADDRFPDSTFDVVLANPPFNQSRWDEGGRLRYDRRWTYGVPPSGNANFAWAQHIVSKLSPGGRGALLLPTGAASGAKPAERWIRAGLVDGDVLSCVIELPAGLIPHVRNPVSLWLFSKSKRAHQGWGSSDRLGQYLLIDARDAAAVTGRGRRALPDEAHKRIIETFAAWRGSPGAALYEDVPGWCRSVGAVEVAERDHDVLPSHHVGLSPTESMERGEGSGEKVAKLRDELNGLFETSRRLEKELQSMLRQL